MKEIGAKWTCDRCGKEEFAAVKKSELPNGHTTELYPIPQGWGSTLDCMNLCQNCYEKYKRIREDFFGKKK